MIATLGGSQLLLPGLVTRGLAANDRVKYLLTLLQAARAAADGVGDQSTLREERVACGVEDSRLDRVVAESVREPDGRYCVPGSQTLAWRTVEEAQTMLEPLRVAEIPTARDLAERVEVVAAELSIDGDLVSAEDIARLTRGPENDGDSLHLVVMDAHRELNRLAREIATELIDGAHVHDLADADRVLVRAFMRGVHSTERVKLEHPGLGTIATRSGTALLIQNDLGTTDGHIVVIRVKGPVVTITYTDVHLARLLFFQELLAPFAVAWEDTRSRNDESVEGGLFHLATGRFEASADVPVGRFLEHLGSRLVFMIDWNRARKRLRRLVGRRVAIRLLRWAAEHEYGHMAFLPGPTAWCTTRSSSPAAVPPAPAGRAHRLSPIGPARDPRAGAAPCRAMRGDRGDRTRRARAGDRGRGRSARRNGRAHPRRGARCRCARDRGPDRRRPLAGPRAVPRLDRSRG